MEKEWYVGCVGCIDLGVNNKSCDYLLNNGHCRPCKADAGGCKLYSALPRVKDETEEERRVRTWDTEKARRLLAEGIPAQKVAEKLEASGNSMQAWIRKGMLAAPEVLPARETGQRAPRGVWDETVYRELYDKGLTDPEAAARMGLDPQTVWKRRKALGLPANGKKKKERTFAHEH